MSVASATPEVGQIVRVRQRLYLVEGLVAAPRPQDSTLVELSCIEDDAHGQELAVLWERELDAAVLTGEEWARIAQRGFDPPEYFSAYLNSDCQVFHLKPTTSRAYNCLFGSHGVLVMGTEAPTGRVPGRGFLLYYRLKCRARRDAD